MFFFFLRKLFDIIYIWINFPAFFSGNLFRLLNFQIWQLFAKNTSSEEIFGNLLRERDPLSNDSNFNLTVLSIVERKSERSSAIERASSLPEPIFYNARYISSILSGIYRAAKRARRCYRVYEHSGEVREKEAQRAGRRKEQKRGTEKSAEEWSISYECIPCKCAGEDREQEKKKLRRDEERARGTSGRRRCEDNWVNTFGPVVRPWWKYIS